LVKQMSASQMILDKKTQTQLSVGQVVLDQKTRTKKTV
jgi:hypothetical protein